MRNCIRFISLRLWPVAIVSFLPYTTQTIKIFRVCVVCAGHAYIYYICVYLTLPDFGVVERQTSATQAFLFFVFNSTTDGGVHSTKRPFHPSNSK
jgi:hypothetical protein